MKLLTALGAIQTPIISPEDADDLVIRAVRMLRVVQLSLDDWREMSPDECAILARAGIRLEAERAARLALAMSGPVGLAKVIAESDAGATEAQMVAELAAARAAASLEGAEVRA